MHCHTGCKTEDIVWAMGLTMQDLFAEIKPGDVFPRYDDPGKAQFEREHIYPGGQIKKVIMRKPDGKKYGCWFHQEGGKWAKGRGGIDPPLYTVAPLEGVVFVCEGEKDVATLNSLGFTAASGADGAGPGKWRKAHTQQLKDFHVCVLGDNDKVGKDFAAETCNALHGVAASVRLLDLSKVWPEIPEHGDVTDMVVELGPYKAAELIGQLSADAAEWVPEEDPLLSLFKPLEEFTEEEAEWLVPGWIPAGQISLMAADGGVGKTTLWCHIIAALSNGTTCVLDPPGHTRPPMRITFMTTEDSVRKKLRKKLRLAGANMANIITPDFVADKSGLLRNVKFGSPEMRKVLYHLRPVFCVFDPVQGFLPPKVNMGSRNEMRDCMAPMISIGEEINTTSMVICHTNKRKGASGRDRIADSADLWDIARSVMMAGFTEEQGVRYLTNEKNNYAPLQETILFSIDDDGQIHKEGSTWKRDREFVQDTDSAKSATKREDCKAYIVQALNEAGGAMPTNDLDAKAKQAGYSFTSVKRAKQDLKKENSVRYFQTGTNKDRVWHIQLLNTAPISTGFVELPEDEPVPFEEASRQTS
jgi:RecA-family ATPase